MGFDVVRDLVGDVVGDVGKSPCSFKPNLSVHQNPRDLSQKIAFLVDMNSDHF